MDELEIPPAQWLEVFEREYLASFIRQGGAAVKVLIVARDATTALVSHLHEAAERNGFLSAHVDQTVQRVYHMERLFNEVARQIDWRQLASDCMRQQLAAHGYSMPEGDPLIDNIAAINGIDGGQVRITIERVVSNSVIRDYAMARDFRLAMAQLCRSVVEHDEMLCETSDRVVEWLAGDLKMVRALRSASLFERINRYTARSMLASLGHWAQKSERGGLLLTVDVSRFASTRSTAAADGAEIRPPTQAAVMDTYEMMRQCIDGTDEMGGIAICFLAGPEFVQDERRGMRAYAALEQRLTDDVRDRRRGNPNAPMVRLGGGWD
jgi:hypothetical protein